MLNNADRTGGSGPICYTWVRSDLLLTQVGQSGLPSRPDTDWGRQKRDVGRSVYLGEPMGGATWRQFFGQRRLRWAAAVCGRNGLQRVHHGFDLVHLASCGPGGQCVRVEVDAESVGDGEPVGLVVVVGFLNRGFYGCRQKPVVEIPPPSGSANTLTIWVMASQPFRHLDIHRPGPAIGGPWRCTSLPPRRCSLDKTAHRTPGVSMRCAGGLCDVASAWYCARSARHEANDFHIAHVGFTGFELADPAHLSQRADDLRHGCARDSGDLRGGVVLLDPFCAEPGLSCEGGSWGLGSGDGAGSFQADRVLTCSVVRPDSRLSSSMWATPGQ